MTKQNKNVSFFGCFELKISCKRNSKSFTNKISKDYEQRTNEQISNSKFDFLIKKENKIYEAKQKFSCY